jgi:hypothetical protein
MTVDKINEILASSKWEINAGSGMSKGLYNFQHESGFISMWYNDNDIESGGGLLVELEYLKSNRAIEFEEKLDKIFQEREDKA